jgi:hypothetical protein
VGVGVDRQRHRRIVAVPGRDDVHWHAAGQHKADASTATTSSRNALVLRRRLLVGSGKRRHLTIGIEDLGKGIGHPTRFTSLPTWQIGKLPGRGGRRDVGWCRSSSDRHNSGEMVRPPFPAGRELAGNDGGD